MKKIFYTLLLGGFLTANVYSQKIDNLLELKEKSKNELFHNLGKAPRTPAFQCEGYWVWGSSVIQGDDGKYTCMYLVFQNLFLFILGGW